LRSSVMSMAGIPAAARCGAYCISAMIHQYSRLSSPLHAEDVSRGL